MQWKFLFVCIYSVALNSLHFYKLKPGPKEDEVSISMDGLQHYWRDNALKTVVSVCFSRVNHNYNTTALLFSL